MSAEPDISQLASLISDKARTSMLMALMSGKAHTATELATVADITAQTASSHLAKMLAGGLLQVRKQGRHKYFQLAGFEVAELIEQMAVFSHGVQSQVIPTGPVDTELAYSRICYDHLAGELAVQLLDLMIAKGYFESDGEKLVLTPEGSAAFSALGFITPIKSSRPVCKSCLDWSERRSHLAGSLGQWLLNYCLDKGWAKKQLDSRVILFTENGVKQLKAKLGI